MAITKGRKSIAEVALQVSPFLKVSENWAPPAEFQVAPYLEVGRLEAVNDEYFTIEGGSVCAISARTEARWLNTVTLANGGTNRTVTYAAADIDLAEDIDVEGTLVAAAGAASATDTANFPIGIAPYPFYNGTIKDRLTNYDLQPFVAIWNMGYFEFPITRTSQTTAGETLARGGLCKPGDGATAGDSGHLVNFQHGTDSVEQICGRVWKIETIAARGGLDKVHTTKGLGLSGTGTGGIPSHLVQPLQSGGNATLKFRVVINVGL